MFIKTLLTAWYREAASLTWRALRGGEAVAGVEQQRNIGHNFLLKEAVDQNQILC